MGGFSHEKPMIRAVFLDRDGTVNEEVGYLRNLDQLRLIPGAGAAIRRLNEAGLKVVLVTNQSGVARGFFPESFVFEVHEHLTRMLGLDGARIDAVYYCPHHPTAGNAPYVGECDCRKPGTGMIDQAAKDLNIDVKNSFMVGDKWIDVELGQRAGAYSILVRSGYAPDDPGNKRPGHISDPDFSAHSLTEATDWIISRVKSDLG
jgi:D-glycero-D-manno-heptose 1,7-bisphosphate phosphatase